MPRVPGLLSAGGCHGGGVVDGQSGLGRRQGNRVGTIDRDLDRRLGPLGQILPEPALGFVLGEPADVDTRDARAARHFVTGGEGSGGVPAGQEQRQREDQHEH